MVNLKQLSTEEIKEIRTVKNLMRSKEPFDEGSKTIKVTEFVTVGEIAIIMDVPITKVIGTCMSLGIMVTMNQRLDAETLTIVADEFGYEVEFITVDIEEAIQVVEDREEDLVFQSANCNGNLRHRRSW